MCHTSEEGSIFHLQIEDALFCSEIQAVQTLTQESHNFSLTYTNPPFEIAILDFVTQIDGEISLI